MKTPTHRARRAAQDPDHRGRDTRDQRQRRHPRTSPDRGSGPGGQRRTRDGHQAGKVSPSAMTLPVRVAAANPGHGGGIAFRAGRRVRPT